MIKKINMRAKAWILTLFICMISLVGFGQHTADLVPNSKVESVVCVDIATELASVEVQLINCELDETWFEDTDTTFDTALVVIQELFVNAFFDTKEIRPGLNYEQTGIVENNLYKPNETKLKRDKAIDTKNSNQVTYRRARDGLICGLDKVL